MSRIQEVAVLAACERVIKNWPVAARVAFREAVLRDVRQFVPGEWDEVTAMIRAEIFGARWGLGLPWPPRPEELVPEPEAVPVIDRDAVVALAERIRALGVELGVRSR